MKLFSASITLRAFDGITSILLNYVLDAKDYETAHRRIYDILRKDYPINGWRIDLVMNEVPKKLMRKCLKKKHRP